MSSCWTIPTEDGGEFGRQELDKGEGLQHPSLSEGKVIAVGNTGWTVHRDNKAVTDLLLFCPSYLPLA